jgi:hypothetical protein
MNSSIEDTHSVKDFHARRQTMTRQEILSYIQHKIPDYSAQSSRDRHLWQFCVHVYPFLTDGKQHWFMEHLVDALHEIEQCTPGYTTMMIDKIATFAKAQAAQVFQHLGEILVLRTLIHLDGTDRSSIELEPQVTSASKNPEFRMKIHNKWYAFEVKTPDLVPFAQIRHNGLQLTSRVTNEERAELSARRKVILSKDLKIQDYLISAEAKFQALKTKKDYEQDITVLIIIWDDYINEAISALKNPSSGLLTEHSFYPESRFENVDSVIVLRHQHHLNRMFYYGQAIPYSLQCNQRPHVFRLEDYRLTRGAYFKNPYADKEMESSVVKALDLHDFTSDFWMFTSEYQPSDLIDWHIGMGFSGLSSCTSSLRAKILSLFGVPREAAYESTRIVAEFNNMNLTHIIRTTESEEQALDVIQAIISNRIDPIMDLGTTAFWEGVNSRLQERYTRLISHNDSSPCPCNSGKPYGDCCSDKLKCYEFRTFYNP